MQQASGSFKVSSWDEEPYWEDEQGRRLTRASVTQAFSGDLEGEGTVEYLMCYRSQGSASFVGMQRVDGSLAGRRGTLLLQTSGTFEDGVVTAEWTVAGSTGDLEGVDGSGGFTAPLGQPAVLSLDFELPS